MKAQMKPTKITAGQHTRHAMQIDRDDPFVGLRVNHYETGPVGRHVDYSKTRRMPAPIADRFRLIQRNPQ